MIEKPTRVRELDEIVVFVIVQVALVLSSAIACSQVSIDQSASGVVRASVMYMLVAGWQPVVAIWIAHRFCKSPPEADDGLRPAALRDTLLSVSIAIGVLCIAFVLERGLAPRRSFRDQGDIPWHFGLAFLSTVAMLWVQAIVEELGWRGFVLPRLMRALGPWPGLMVHGVLWGLGYLPVFAATGADLSKALGFVVTCALLGVPLGWIRLRSKSIYASAASNATLTISAGLPMVLAGQTSELAAVFEPPGWIALTVATLVILGRPHWRAAVRTPAR